MQQGTLKGRRCLCQSLLCLVGLVPEQAAVTTIALCPYQPPGTKLLRAQLKSHLFNSFDKHLHRPWDKVPLGSPVYLGRQKKNKSYFSVGKGPGGRKGHGALEKLQEMWCGEPTQYVCPDSRGTGGFDGLGATDNMVWSDHLATMP